MSEDNWEISAMDELKQSSPPAKAGPPEEQLNPPDPGLTSAVERPLMEPNPMFFGPQGLRPGWRLLLYVGMWRIFRELLGLLLEKIDPHVPIKLWLDLITEFGSFAAVAVPAVVMGWMEKRPFGDYGLPRRGAFGKLFWTGMV